MHRVESPRLPRQPHPPELRVELEPQRPRLLLEQLFDQPHATDARDALQIEHHRGGALPGTRHPRRAPGPARPRRAAACRHAVIRGFRPGGEPFEFAPGPELVDGSRPYSGVRFRLALQRREPAVVAGLEQAAVDGRDHPVLEPVVSVEPAFAHQAVDISAPRAAEARAPRRVGQQRRAAVAAGSRPASGAGPRIVAGLRRALRHRIRGHRHILRAGRSRVDRRASGAQVARGKRLGSCPPWRPLPTRPSTLVSRRSTADPRPSTFDCRFSSLDCMAAQ